MQDLSRTLSDYDPELLRVIANRWDVDLNVREARNAGAYLAQNMLRAEKVADAWARLTDEQRGALQALLGAGGKMPSFVFARLYGEIRQMGPDKMEREKPYLNPASLSEALYYRGLVSIAYGEGIKGSQAFIYVPTDLMPMMPIHKTGYKLDDEEAEIAPVSALPQPNNIRQADTAIVDDLTTLLAYC